MRFAASLSLEPEFDRAVADAVARLRAGLDGADPELVLAFVSAHHAPSYERLPELARVSRAATVVGCSGGGVLGDGREIESGPGLALLGAVLPGVEVASFHLETDRLPALDDRDAWAGLVRAPGAEECHVVLLADPFTADVESLLAGLDRNRRGGCTVGGLVSGGAHIGRNALLDGGVVHRSGVVGVTLSGDVAVDTVVAQGCRPVGDPMFVTGADGTLLRALDGEPAAHVLRHLYGALDSRDQELFRHSLFLGIAMRESRETYQHGDFLIRNIAGLDAASGALIAGASLKEGAIVQFHVRDAAASAADLDRLLAAAATRATSRPAAALLFSCLGRGAQLYGRPDHDSEVLRRHLGDLPLAGFFCNGEIGPVHGRTFVHGYTSSFALFAPRVAPNRV